MKINKHWRLYLFNGLRVRKEAEITWFYLLPTIEYMRDRVFDDDGDFSFDINFRWLFWGITISKY